MFIEGAKFEKDLINNIYWLFMENETSIPFYTSDNPVVKLNHHSQNCTENEYVFPINNKLLISILDKEAFDLYERFYNGAYPIKKIEVVKTYNEAQIHSSYHQVFSSVE